MEKRCKWAGNDPLYIQYHDEEWGVPVKEDQKLFEFLLLESFQAGLSWITILRKRENFRRAFDDFDYKKISKYSNQKIEELMQNKGIIRNRLKIKSAISNADAFMSIQKEFGSFSSYYWAFSKGETLYNSHENQESVPATTPLSDSLSKDLKKRGFKFVGSTIVYAFIQATGMVNDHIIDCFKHPQK
ncbi:MAG: DNA-3-methyladenine glycosylase I [Flavobacteriales bacterium]|jgi:DNA-3-methyladenine glycosylase I|nr:DNA-3-methyladenine glycosylase I [Flavobacteriales bacterium]